MTEEREKISAFRKQGIAMGVVAGGIAYITYMLILDQTTANPRAGRL